MKKLLSLCVLVLGLFSAVPAQAQLKFGVKGGLNLAKLSLSEKTGNLDSDNTTGCFIGPMAEFTIPVVNLGIDGALLFSQRGKGDCKQQGLEIPVNLKHTIGLGSLAGLYLAAGPDFFFNFKDVKNSAGLKKKDAQVAVSLGAGLKLLGHLQVGANYLIPISNSHSIGDENIKTKTWQVSAAYIF